MNEKGRWKTRRMTGVVSRGSGYHTMSMHGHTHTYTQRPPTHLDLCSATNACGGQGSSARAARQVSCPDTPLDSLPVYVQTGVMAGHAVRAVPIDTLITSTHRHTHTHTHTPNIPTLVAHPYSLLHSAGLGSNAGFPSAIPPASTLQSQSAYPRGWKAQMSVHRRPT